ncbi:hypothetical protein NLI96_g9310 [Meripilus lineatus]|uniref:Brix domain-containing protein n=1 Tax=Meripilus lineatus TaxID=2056292 RepID=A0AAD5UXG2_9APHY|nr:hypothetical protein NLI96_g9310 [Physisporinus lineatus]
MPEADSTRKRSRSPSDSDQPKHKRANTGTTTDDSQARISQVSLSSAPTTQREVKTDPRDDTAASTPSPRQASDKPGTTMAEPSTGAGSSTDPAPPAANIHMRCLIVTQDASIIIGKGGSHVNEIREKSGARVMVSESIPGNPERILNVSGPLDAVSKAFGLIVRRINDEPFDQASVPGSRAVTIKFMIPNSRMGSVIGKGGSKIKEIQDASGARLNASEGMLPGSTERVLSVSGVADAIHIATYYIGNILIEANERMPSRSDSSYRPSSYRRAPTYSGSSYVPGYSNPYPAGGPSHSHNPPQQLQTQQIYIPNDLVGCIIGKGGAKINEIRHMSASNIKIMEPGAVGVGVNGAPAPAGSEGERLVVITGQPANIQMAVQLLYHRLEQEKQKQMRTAPSSVAAANLEPLQLVLLVETSIGIIKMASLLKAQKKQAAKLDAKGKRKAESMDVDEESSSPAKKRPRNKQRVLLLSSRGITHRMRHLMNDLEALLPQVKKDSKLDSKNHLNLIPELADLNNCNNALYFEARRHEDLYLWAVKTPNGPSIKMHVQNVHTMDELKMTGNCLKGSRGVLSFDKAFDESEWGKLTKEVFTQIFGVPPSARKAKPFVDHILTFSILDNKIWFRNFQIIEKDPLQPNGPPQTSLIEIGPRFVLTPIRIFEGAFGGATVYSNPEFVSPAAIRSSIRREKGQKYGMRKQAEQEQVARRDLRKREEDELAVAKVFS